MNQIESWIYFEIGKLEFLAVCATFVHIAGFFERSRHLDILVSVCLFLHFSLICESKDDRQDVSWEADRHTKTSR